MPQPTPSDVHVNRPLTNISIAYAQKADRFIAERLFPRIPVSKKSDTYFSFDRRDWYRIEAKERAPGSESAGSGWRIDSTPEYRCKRYDVHKDVDDETRANSDEPLNLDRSATEWVTQQMLLRRENQLVSNYLTTGVWDLDQTGVAAAPGANQFLQWNDDASDPVKNVTDQITRIGGATGLEPNVLVVAPDVLNALKNHPDIIDRIKYTQRGIVSVELLAGLFEVEEVLVPRAVVDTSAEGAATDATDYFFKKAAFLAYRENSPGIMKPTAGYIFTWTGLLGAGAYGGRIKRFRIEKIESDRIEGSIAFDPKVVAPELGVYFDQAIA